MSLASVKCLKYNMFTFNVRNLKKVSEQYEEGQI